MVLAERGLTRVEKVVWCDPPTHLMMASVCLQLWKIFSAVPQVVLIDSCSVLW